MYVVKRYRMVQDYDWDGEPNGVDDVEDPKGEWVKWEDYEALQKQLDLERGYYTDPDPFQYG